MIKRFVVLAVLVLSALNAFAGEKNIDLATLPPREGVQLTIYNSEDITLVKERRAVTVKKGMNKLQFSWAGTLIDPSSVELRPLEHAREIEVVDTVFPGQKPQHLIWNIQSRFEGQVLLEVTYFTSGLTWDMDYVAISNPQEEVMSFDGYVRVYNNSGEEYEGAEVRLIVGTINLVEKIAELARRQGIPTPLSGSIDYEKMRRDEAGQAFNRAQSALEAPQSAAKGIVKEGLSEYFMFAIEGKETVPNGWSKRIRAVKAEGVKFDILYRMRNYQYGSRPSRFFLWNNDDEHKLGESPLPDGRVRLFRDNGQDGLSFLGEQNVRYVPVKGLLEINLGPDDLVVYESRKMSTSRFNFTYTRNGNDHYVTGWDEKQVWTDTVRNYRSKPIRFELRRIWTGDAACEPGTASTAFDYQTVETPFTVAPRATTDASFTTTFHMGSNQKQNHVKLR